MFKPFFSLSSLYSLNAIYSKSVKTFSKALSVTLALSTISAGQAFAQSGSTAQQLLERDLKAVVRTFQRDTRFYHYFYMAGGTTNLDPWFLKYENRQNWLRGLFESRAGAFWDLNNHVTDKVNAGPGMYMALDPNSTTEYGDTAAILDVPKGTRFITTVNPIKLGSDTIKAMISEGMISPLQVHSAATLAQMLKDKKISAVDYQNNKESLELNNGLTMVALKFAVLPKHRSFREALQKSFENLNLMFVEYGYKSHQRGFCKQGRVTAFVFTGTRSNEKDQWGNIKANIPGAPFKYAFANDSTIGKFSSEENETVRLTLEFRSVLRQIRKVNLFDKATVDGILKQSALSSSDVAALRSLSFRCEAP